MRPAFSASFDWLGGVSVGVPSWLFCDFPCPRWLQKLQKASDFCNNFCNNGCKKPSKYPQIEQSTTTFCVIPFRVYSSYGFLRSFCNNGCKTMVTYKVPTIGSCKRNEGKNDYTTLSFFASMPLPLPIGIFTRGKQTVY